MEPSPPAAAAAAPPVLQPTAVTYGVLLVACERRRDVDRAFQLYQAACDEVRLRCHKTTRKAVYGRQSRPFSLSLLIPYAHASCPC
jgi:hypothetical protein